MSFLKVAIGTIISFLVIIGLLTVAHYMMKEDEKEKAMLEKGEGLTITFFIQPLFEKCFRNYTRL